MTLADIVRMGKSQADEAQTKRQQQRKSNSAESSLNYRHKRMTSILDPLSLKDK